jgi:hypothetical protein
VKNQGLNLTKISSEKDFKTPQFLGLIFIFFRGGFLFIEEKRVSVHSFVATQKFWFVSEKRGSVHSLLLSENDKSPNR